MVNITNNQLPTSSQPLSTFGKGNVPTFVATEWYRFFTDLNKLLSDLVNGVLGFTTESGAAATGTTQGTALLMTTEWIEITTTPVNSGVLLSGFGAGVPNFVFNEGVNSLNVYPPSGSKINALAANAPYVLAAGKMQVFSQTTPTQFRTMNLG